MKTALYALAYSMADYAFVEHIPHNRAIALIIDRLLKHGATVLEAETIARESMYY